MGAACLGCLAAAGGRHPTNQHRPSRGWACTSKNMKSVSVSMNMEIVSTLHIVQFTDTQFMKRAPSVRYVSVYRLVFMKPKAIAPAPAERAWHTHDGGARQLSTGAASACGCADGSDVGAESAAPSDGAASHQSNIKLAARSR